MKQERRFLTQEIVVDEVGNPKIVGYAAKFSPSRSSDLGGFVEEISPDAFTASLNDSENDCVALFNHDHNHVLGRESAGTLRLSVDGTGLKYEIDPPDTTVARDLITSMKRKDIKNSSFGFYCLRDSFKEDRKTGDLVRTIHEARVFDVSPVVFPAYKDATSQVRALFPEDKGNVPEEITSKIAEIRAAKRQEKRGRSIMGAVAGMKWAILPEKLEAIGGFLNSWSEGHKATKEEIQAAMMGSDSPFEAETSSGVAVIPVYGVISQRLTLMAEICGGTSCDLLTSQLRAAVADPSVSSIVLDIDSPGGSVTGVPELAAEIMKLRDQKQIIAVSNGMAASAALWIAASCSKVVCIPSGEVGSIGVYQMHQDVSGALDKAGVSISFISAGKYKVDGNPYETLSDSARADMQAGVDEFYDMFVAGVAAGRGVSVETVEEKFGQGRMLSSKAALSAGLIDQVATLDEVVASLSQTDSPAISVETVVDPVVSGVEANVGGCMCECPECIEGNCAGCLDEDCSDGNCICGDDSLGASVAQKNEYFITTTEVLDENGKRIAWNTMAISEEFSKLGPEELNAELNANAALKVKLMSM